MATTSRTGAPLEGGTTASRAMPDALRDSGRRVRRGHVRGDVRGALWLIAPLAIFMLVFFVMPIASLLSRSAWDPVVLHAFPATAEALKGWAGDSVPAPATFAALAHDIENADAAGTLGDAATRLNQDAPGMRALLMRTRRQLAHANAADTPPKLATVDSRWGEVATWKTLSRSLSPLTASYLLRAVDHAETSDGHVVALSSEEGVYVGVLGRTLWMSAVVTLLVTLLGFPLSYWLTGLPERHQQRAMMAILIPFWTSILVRIAAWMVVLPREGLVNEVLMSAHLIDSPVALLYNRTGVYISMVHILIPFMVLPVFAVMRGIPRSYQMAAISLGSHPFGAFWRVYVPQTLPGVAAGAMLVFVSALGYYIAPALLGGAGDQMLSYYIAYFTNTAINWGFAAALSALLLVATGMLFVVYRMLVAVLPAHKGA
ncbi:polyamine ABC transporter substrate-binding protein [Paraburkholderia caffeinilytica]|nr:ABC transporter permease [Paraburkholderia caffeinilytica]AXL53454.1 polyamine ABC transporter substrate-binding protein [Paraburkholderia caffeinilytica]CAB3781399.1 hypothetical protein LMG28690_01193 [Paraburkholderia caffeinilytica]